MAVSTQPTSSQPGASGPSAGRSSLVEMQARRCMYLASHFAHRPSLRLCEPVASPTEEVQNAHMSRKPGLVSIGYEGRTAEDLVAALVEARIKIAGRYIRLILDVQERALKDEAEPSARGSRRGVRPSPGTGQPEGEP